MGGHDVSEIPRAHYNRACRVSQGFSHACSPSPCRRECLPSGARAGRFLREPRTRKAHSRQLRTCSSAAGAFSREAVRSVMAPRVRVMAPLRPRNPPADLQQVPAGSKPGRRTFYRVWNGKSPGMPAFKSQLSRDEIWTAVEYGEVPSPEAVTSLQAAGPSRTLRLCQR